jgi:hypothetical protein
MLITLSSKLIPPPILLVLPLFNRAQPVFNRSRLYDSMERVPKGSQSCSGARVHAKIPDFLDGLGQHVEK